MKNNTILTLVTIIVLSGCAGMTKTQQGAAIGTGVGAATGAALGQAIGGNTASTLLGAGAGAVAGGIAGGLIGSYMDKQEQELRQALANVESASIQREQDVLAVSFRSDVLFSTDSAVLQPGGYSEIDRVAGVLMRYPETRIRVEGHTDGTGSEIYNLRLSEDRALAVKNALIARGIDPARIEAIGFGEVQPVAGNDTEAGRQLNRRVNILIVPIRT
ncbi:MAG: OmpA family protein [Desulforhabdus sp.]|jgi:outer membrane protein OmpA-like peptidoglycan-associated protein|nr:OmpA family protein [Desulforhabdus sp.]